MPQYALGVVSGVRGTTQYVHELFEGSWNTPVLPLNCSWDPWAAHIPPWVGSGVRGHPHTPTNFLLGPVGGPDTSLGRSWGKGSPQYSHFGRDECNNYLGARLPTCVQLMVSAATAAAKGGWRCNGRLLQMAGAVSRQPGTAAQSNITKPQRASPYHLW